MSGNVSIVNHTKGAHSFSWGSQMILPQSASNIQGSTWGTSIVAPSNGQFKESPWAVYQAMVTGTGAVTATVSIQVTMDSFTGIGVSIPVVLTNASTSVTLPTYTYTAATLQNTFPTGTLQVTTTGAGSFYAIPIDYTVSILVPNYNFDQKILSLQPGMNVNGPGLGAGTTIASITNSQTLVLTAAPSGLSVSPGLYWVTFSNNYWCTTALGTITLNGTTTASDGFTSVAPWKYVRANVTAVTGTNAVVSALMGY